MSNVTYPKQYQWLNDAHSEHYYFARKRSGGDPDGVEEEMSRWLEESRTSLNNDAFLFLERQCSRYRFSDRVFNGKISGAEADAAFQQIIDAGMNSLRDEIEFTFNFVAGRFPLAAARSAAIELLPKIKTEVRDEIYKSLYRLVYRSDP